MGLSPGGERGEGGTRMPTCFRPRQPPNPTSVAACAADRETAGGYRIGGGGGSAVPCQSSISPPLPTPPPPRPVLEKKGLLKLGLVVEVKAVQVVHQL